MDSIRKRTHRPKAGMVTAHSKDVHDNQELSSVERKRKPLRSTTTSFPNRPTVILMVGAVVAALSRLSFLEDNIMEQFASPKRVLFEVIPYPLRFKKHKVNSIYIPRRPRIIGFSFDSTESGSYPRTENLEPQNSLLTQTRRKKIKVSTGALERQEWLLDSASYDRQRVAFESEECKAQYEWQKSSLPTCNFFYENDWTNLGQDSQDVKDHGGLIANGHWRDVWSLKDAFGAVALKTMRYQHDYTPRNTDRHRRDAVAMERLTASEWVMDIYGFCGNSGLFEFADGGSLTDGIFIGRGETAWTSKERLLVAYQVASSIAELHNFAKEGVAAMAHVDISTNQFVWVNSAKRYLLNDFNRCRFIRWNEEKDEACPYYVGNNPGAKRSPEEYWYTEQSEMVDVYSMGNIFYSLITSLAPFQMLLDEEPADLVKRGERPPLNREIRESDDPFDQALLKAIKMCWKQDPKIRAPARDVQKYIGSQLDQLGVERLVEVS